MATITLQGARVKNFSQGSDPDQKLSGSYEMLTSNGKVIATQGFNGYGDMKLELCPDTRAALNEFERLLTRDINLSLGFE